MEIHLLLILSFDFMSKSPYISKASFGSIRFVKHKHHTGDDYISSGKYR